MITKKLFTGIGEFSIQPTNHNTYMWHRLSWVSKANNWVSSQLRTLQIKQLRRQSKIHITRRLQLKIWVRYFSDDLRLRHYGSGLMTAYPKWWNKANSDQRKKENAGVTERQRLLLRRFRGSGIPRVRVHSLRHKKNGHGLNIMMASWNCIPISNGRDLASSPFTCGKRLIFRDYTKLWPLIEDISRAT